jgi:hypothetical protein
MKMTCKDKSETGGMQQVMKINLPTPNPSLEKGGEKCYYAQQ